MAKHDLIVRISKIKSSLGDYYFEITTNLNIDPSYIDWHSATFPKIRTKPFIDLANQVDKSLDTIFLKAKEIFTGRNVFTYKFIFSNEFSSIGYSNIVHTEKIKIFKELVVPMNEQEIYFIHNCIPDYAKK